MSDPRKIPPTLEEVTEYIGTRLRPISAEKFFDHYEANGWKVGRVRMVNWQAAVRTWENNDRTWPKDGAAKLTEWEIKQKLDRLRDLRERKRAITNPGGSAFSMSLDAAKRAVVSALEAKIDELKKELGE